MKNIVNQNPSIDFKKLQSNTQIAKEVLNRFNIFSLQDKTTNTGSEIIEFRRMLIFIDFSQLLIDLSLSTSDTENFRSTFNSLQSQALSFAEKKCSPLDISQSLECVCISAEKILLENLQGYQGLKDDKYASISTHSVEAVKPDNQKKTVINHKISSINKNSELISKNNVKVVKFDEEPRKIANTITNQTISSSRKIVEIKPPIIQDSSIKNSGMMTRSNVSNKQNIPEINNPNQKKTVSKDQNLLSKISPAQNQSPEKSIPTSLSTKQESPDAEEILPTENKNPEESIPSNLPTQEESADVQRTSTSQRIKIKLPKTKKKWTSTFRGKAELTQDEYNYLLRCEEGLKIWTDKSFMERNSNGNIQIYFKLIFQRDVPSMGRALFHQISTKFQMIEKEKRFPTCDDEENPLRIRIREIHERYGIKQPENPKKRKHSKVAKETVRDKQTEPRIKKTKITAGLKKKEN